MSFWTDSKVSDDFTPDDKYFYLYLFTNPHTNLCGCYEVSIKQMAYETGLTENRVKSEIQRLEREHNVIRYCEQTKEVLLINWHKYNWTSSDKFMKPMLREVDTIKCKGFKDYLESIVNGEEVSIGYRYGMDTVSADEGYPIDTTVSVSVSDTDTVSDTVSEIIMYLNEMTGQHYKASTQETKRLVKARIKEGYTVEDFKTVIYKKTKEWSGTDNAKYLRPQTLFGNKFESYLNQLEGGKPQKQDALEAFMNGEIGDDTTGIW